MPIARPFLLSLSLLLLPAPAQAAEVVVVVTRSGDALQIAASAEFEGTIARTWQVLTDYNRLAEFVPDVHYSRVIARDGNQVQVEQKGAARLLFLSFPIDVRLAITEYPHERIVSRAVSGNFREMHGTYALQAGQGRVQLRYTGRMVPDFFVPPLIGTLVLRRNIESTFAALVDEIERKQAQPAPPEKP
jgi:ribosome-associated toxin RatA of RatAB toxin-antitoxin module